jgi:hypothetical protein
MPGQGSVPSWRFGPIPRDRVRRISLSSLWLSLLVDLAREHAGSRILDSVVALTPERLDDRRVSRNTTKSRLQGSR